MTDALLDQIEAALKDFDADKQSLAEADQFAEWLQALVGRLRSMDELRAIDAETVGQTRENFLWAQGEMERLQAALSKYGRHFFHCEAMNSMRAGSGVRCSCGYLDSVGVGSPTGAPPA